MANFFDQFDEKPQSQGNFFDQFDEKSTGGGRGGQGGPKAGEVAAYEKQKRKEAVAPQRAAIIGAGQGATAGLMKYPVAAIAMGADRLRGGNLSWEDAKKYTSEEIEQTAKDNPVAYGAGNVVGAVASPIFKAGAIVKGTGVGANMARAAIGSGAYGAAQGYSEKEDLTDAAVGAGTGALIGGALTGVAQGARALKDKVVTSKPVADWAERTLKPGADKLWSPYEQKLASLLDKYKGNEYSDIASKLSKKEKDELVESMFAGTAKDAAKETLKQIPKFNLGDAATGAVGGGILAGVTGQDVTTGALGGAALMSGKPIMHSVAERVSPRVASKVQEAAVKAGLRNPSLTPGLKNARDVFAATSMPMSEFMAKGATLFSTQSKKEKK